MLTWYQKHRKMVALGYGILYLVSCYVMLLSYIPRQVTIERGKEEITLAAPLTVDRIAPKGVLPVETKKKAPGENIALECKLFGVFPVATMEATIAEETTVDAVGCPVGIYMHMKHVYVAGTKELKDIFGNAAYPSAYIVKEGDYIVEANQIPLESKEQLLHIVQNSNGQPVVLRLLRNQEIMDVRIFPVKAQSGQYRLGIWVKDDAAGVGTMTFVKKDHTFGALGHGISSASKQEILPMKEGYLYETNITKVTPSSVGSPGEITGWIQYGKNNQWGEISSNQEVGIFGTIHSDVANMLERRTYPIGYKQEIQREDAVMLFGVAGHIKSYQIKIDQINYQAKEKNKSFVFHVTDGPLIEKTGGIVQGMSGSPIIQDGKIIGAVTHVFVNDPTRGYGIFIEEMLEE